MDEKERTSGPTAAYRLSVDDQKLLFEVIEDFEEDNGPVGFAVEVLVPFMRALVQLELPEPTTCGALILVICGLAREEKKARATRSGLRLVSE